jgi:hypothetical protein
MAKGMRSIADFYHDALAGTLPQVAFVDPGFTTGLRTDEHPFGDIRAGQAFVHDVAKAVDDSILNPATPARKTSPGFEQIGFRVPCLVIFPWTRPGALATNKFIEWRFGLEPLSLRDAPGRNIGELLFRFEKPRLEGAAIVEALPRHLVASGPCEGEELEGIGPSTEALEGALGRRDREEQVQEARRQSAGEIQQGLQTGSRAAAPARGALHERERAAQCTARELAQDPSDDGFARALGCGSFEAMGWNGKLPRLRDVLEPGF